MRIGKQDQPYSAIATSDAASITVRGKDLCGEVIGKMDFTSYFWFLVTGVEPNEQQLFFANAVLCALAEHGLVPSVVAARMTYAAAPEALQGAVAAGLLGCGSVVLGSGEAAGRFYVECVSDWEESGGSAKDAAIRGIQRLRAERKAIPGFGHPQHAGGDPRANLLLKLAEERGAAGRHVEMLYAIRDALPDAIGKALPVNVNGAIPAVMLDVDFPLSALKGIGLLCRTAGLIGHLTEEAERPIGFILSGKAAEAIEYDGPERGVMEVSDRLVDQRMRNRVIEQLEDLTAGVEHASQVGISNYVNWFYDWMPTEEGQVWPNSAMTDEEHSALLEVRIAMDEATSPALMKLSDTDYITRGWPSRVQPIAQRAFALFSKRGRYSEDYEEQEPGDWKAA